jgi:hypothetical protein
MFFSDLKIIRFPNLGAHHFVNRGKQQMTYYQAMNHLTNQLNF